MVDKKIAARPGNGKVSELTEVGFIPLLFHEFPRLHHPGSIQPDKISPGGKHPDVELGFGFGDPAGNDFLAMQIQD